MRQHLLCVPHCRQVVDTVPLLKQREVIEQFFLACVGQIQAELLRSRAELLSQSLSIGGHSRRTLAGLGDFGSFEAALFQMDQE